MQLHDEQVEFHYDAVLAPPPEAWSPLAELQSQHLISAARLKAILPQLQQARGQLAAERDLPDPPRDQRPLDAGFIDQPQKYLDLERRHGDKSDLARVQATAGRLRQEVDRVVVLGPGESLAGPRAIFAALCHRHHNELSSQDRLGTPRLYFTGDSADTDAFHDLFDLLERGCVDPDLRDERWALVVIDRTGESLETATAYRHFRAEAARFYGSNNANLRQYIVPITGRSGGKVRDLFLAQGFTDADILNLPDNIGCPFSAFTPAGLLPAALAGLDARAILLGAAAMTRRFFEDPFERNPVLQFAAANHLLSEEHGKRTRLFAVWSDRLGALARWYEQLVTSALGRQGRGPTPATCLMPRDAGGRGQQGQDGPRTTVVNNLIVKTPTAQPLAVGMADRNEDDLNQYARKTLPELTRAAHAGWRRALVESARPTADLVLPAVTEVTIGQAMQLLMLATAVEAKLMGVNPYGRPAATQRQKLMDFALNGSHKG
jgi:glucose-6-phosphate isomerase